MSNTEQVREIITAYLLVNGKQPVILSSDETNIQKIMETASSKNIKLKKFKITSNKDKLTEMGKNFFQKKLPLEARQNPVPFRNKLIVEWHGTIERLSHITSRTDTQVSWGRICQKYGVGECTVDQFSKWLLDYNEYTNGEAKSG